MRRRCPLKTSIQTWLVAGLALSALTASEHHGQVTFGGLPVPGATVTAIQAGKKLVAVTDQQGAYAFPNLADGVWTIQVEMLCFSTIQKDVTIAPDAPSPEWQLKLLPLNEMNSQIKPAAAPAPETSTTTANPPHTKRSALHTQPP